MILRDKNSIYQAMKAGRVKSLTVNPKFVSDKKIEELLAMAREGRVVIHKSPPDPPRGRGRGARGRRAADIEAHCDPFAYVDIETIGRNVNASGDSALVIAADHIQDPRNLGAVLRTAAAVKADGLIIEKKRCCEVTDTVYETSCGGADVVPVARVSNLRQALKKLKDWGCWIAGTDERAEESFYSRDLSMPLALVFGSEGDGLSRLVKEESDFLLRIPTNPDFPSLNVSVAAGIAIFETARRQGRLAE